MTSIKEAAVYVTELERENGELSVDDVINRAAPEDSPLHSFFEWDDAVCGVEHRRNQARQLIRRIKIEVTIHDVPLQVVRYVRDMANQDHGYRHILRVKDDVDAARDSLIDEIMRVEKAARRARAVAAVLGTEDDVQRIIDLSAMILRRAGIGRAGIGDRPQGTA